VGCTQGIVRFPTASAQWVSPEPTLSIPFLPMNEIAEVGIFGLESGSVLAGAIELVSPANKDRASQREAFVSKCETYLRQGVGLVMVDVVTVRRANLHSQLLERLAKGQVEITNSDLYAAAYRPLERGGQACVDVWQEGMTLGGLLPVLPLWLPGEICLPVDLARTYERTCREHRIVGA